MLSACAVGPRPYWIELLVLWGSDLFLTAGVATRVLPPPQVKDRNLRAAAAQFRSAILGLLRAGNHAWSGHRRVIENVVIGLVAPLLRRSVSLALIPIFPALSKRQKTS